MTTHTIQIYLYTLLIVVFISFALFLFFKKRHKKSSPDLMVWQKKGFGKNLLSLFSESGKNFSEIAPKLEEILLTADVGVSATQELLASLQDSAGSQQDLKNVLQQEMQTLVKPKNTFRIDTSRKPFVIYMVGVNGVGKTTTAAKLAVQFQQQGFSCLVVAADTFRAAAAEQLATWASRHNIFFQRGAENADPSSVIVEGLKTAVSKTVDIVIVDTAGRLHTKSNLMEELKKMSRMCEKILSRPPDEIFLVVDAITGQNGFQQAKIFLEAVPVSGLILTKYDGTAKGGIVFAIAKETGIPIRFLGLGEKVEDLQNFDPEKFVERIFL